MNLPETSTPPPHRRRVTNRKTKSLSTLEGLLGAGDGEKKEAPSPPATCHHPPRRVRRDTGRVTKSFSDVPDHILLPKGSMMGSASPFKELGEGEERSHKLVRSLRRSKRKLLLSYVMNQSLQQNTTEEARFHQAVADITANSQHNDCGNDNTVPASASGNP